MEIRPSASIRQNYNEISRICKKTQAPVYLTKNGAGDLVVMDIDAFHQREKMLDLREALLSAEESRLRGDPGRTVEQVTVMMRAAIQEASRGE